MQGETWLLAFRYDSMAVAGEAYELARDLVFGLDIDEASAYRIKLNNVPHVVVLGEGQLLEAVREMFEKACRHGQPVELPIETARLLFERRRTGKIPGVFWERRSE